MPKTKKTNIHDGNMAALRAIMAALRDRDTGCPWDLEQDFASIAPYTIEEAYEVADAIARGDMADLCDELGDLLLQVVYHAQMADEAGAFVFDDVVKRICEKMIRRHPHVFARRDGVTPKARKGAWEKIKRQERQARAGARRPASVLDDIPNALPALSRALKIQKRVAAVGFDWPDLSPVLAKVDEELAELRDAVEDGTPEHALEEFGDLMFAMVNLARHLQIDPETAVAAANRKFCARFGLVETRLAERGVAPENAGLALMESLWNEVKKAEFGLERLDK